MNKQNLQAEKDLRRFLLGEMSETERTAFEERFISDEEIFERLRAEEDELIESYVRGNLSESEISKFEKNFLNSAKRREKVAFTRAMLAEFAAQNAAKEIATDSPKESWLANFIASFIRPSFAFGSALAIAALLIGGWFLLRNNEKPNDLARITPTPSPVVSPAQTVSPTPQIVENITTNANNQPANKPQSVNTNKPVNQNDDDLKKEIEANLNRQNDIPAASPTPKKIEESGIIPVLALYAGGVRSGGSTATLELSANSKAANLQLNLESQDYKNYRAEILDQNGARIFQAANIRAKNNVIGVQFPTKSIGNGDYVVKVYGANPTEKEESVADYQFRVMRK